MSRTETLQETIDRRAHERREHERMTSDRRRKPRQTFEQFQKHVDTYCAKKGKRR